MRTVQSGGVPWTIKEASRTRLSESGRLRATVRGLLIIGTGNPSLDGTTGTVEQVVASLTCENPMWGSTGAPTIVSTSPATLSSEGNARINERITLPDTCLGPIVLIREQRDRPVDCGVGLLDQHEHERGPRTDKARPPPRTTGAIPYG
jgi:hypothetical protein